MKEVERGERGRVVSSGETTVAPGALYTMKSMLWVKQATVEI